MDCQSQHRQAKAILYGTGASSDGMSCLAWTSQVAARASSHMISHIDSGRRVPGSQYSVQQLWLCEPPRGDAEQLGSVLPVQQRPEPVHGCGGQPQHH